jgi:glycosyltransferase involved in cell wall biosynthesis
MPGMRILIVSEDIPALQLGGLGKHAVRMGNALIDAGHEVTLMGRSDVDYATCAEEVGFSGLFIGGFDFRNAGWKERSFGVFMPYKRPALAKRIARAILKVQERFDVVHYHGHLPLVGSHIPDEVNFVQTRHDQGSECLMHVRLRNGRPCDETDPRACAGCATSRPNSVQTRMSSVAVAQYRRETAESFRRHKTIFVSDFLRQRFMHVVSPKFPIRSSVIHNFIDLRSLPEIVNRTARAGARPLAVIAGRIDEAKGVGQFLQVLSGKREIPFDVEIIGDGPLRQQIENTFRQPWVHFQGWCSTSETALRMSRADYLVVPSICEESCATTVLEGLALGKPVMALARGGTPELKRYERWHGQLSLYREMQDLVDCLHASPPYQAVPEREFKADIRILMHEVLDVYRRGAFVESVMQENRKP